MKACLEKTGEIDRSFFFFAKQQQIRLLTFCQVQCNYIYRYPWADFEGQNLISHRFLKQGLHINAAIIVLFFITFKVVYFSLLTPLLNSVEIHQCLRQWYTDHFAISKFKILCTTSVVIWRFLASKMHIHYLPPLYTFTATGFWFMQSLQLTSFIIIFYFCFLKDTADIELGSSFKSTYLNKRWVIGILFPHVDNIRPCIWHAKRGQVFVLSSWYAGYRILSPTGNG